MDLEARHDVARRPAIISMFKCRQASGRGVHQALLSPHQHSEAPAHSSQVTTERRLLQKVAAENMRAYEECFKNQAQVSQGRQAVHRREPALTAHKPKGCWDIGCSQCTRPGAIQKS